MNSKQNQRAAINICAKCNVLTRTHTQRAFNKYVDAGHAKQLHKMEAADAETSEQVAVGVAVMSRVRRNKVSPPLSDTLHSELSGT